MKLGEADAFVIGCEALHGGSCSAGRYRVLRVIRSFVWMLLLACPALFAQVKENETAPSILQAPIHYPSAAVSAGEQGSVVVAAVVDAGGHARDAHVQRSSGHPRLDAAALQSIAQWSFRPATRDGKAVAQWVNVPIDFSLRAGPAADSVGPMARAVVGAMLVLLGSLSWAVGFLWSVVLAKRQSVLWLSGMVALWIVAYPVFVVRHWSRARRNLIPVLAGCAMFLLGQYLMVPV